jgi:hypothetical protein
MGLDEHPVDLFEVHDAGLVADGFDERAEAQVAGAPQQAFAGAHNESQGFGREGVVAQAGAVELVENERFDGFGSEPRQECRVRDAGADFLVDGQGQGLEQGWLAQQDQIVRAREVLAQQAEFAQTIGGHEMGVVNDGDEHFAGAVDAEGLLDEQALTAMIVALELDLKGFAEDAERVVVRVLSL